MEPLIGPSTITTSPRKTSAAFAERGKAAATLGEGLDDSDDVMRDLAKVGIDIARVTDSLLDEGIDKFIEAYDDILQTIAAKSAAHGVGRPDTSDNARRPSV